MGLNFVDYLMTMGGSVSSCYCWF